MKNKIYKFSIFLVCSSLLLTACSSEKKKETKDKKETKKSEIEFKQCGDFECGDLKVPMDYKNPEDRKLDIAVIKSPASDPDNKIGVLFVNPGGPGASGVEMVRSSASFIFPEEVLDKFDIIGWDPRGSGGSTKLTCTTDLDFLFEGVDYSPDSSSEEEQLKDANAKLGEKCEKEDADLVPFLSTENTVRDMDQIRKALGEKQINFLGFSYGTSLGQMYATMFPKNVRTMVIDGVIDLEAEPKNIAKEQALGFENSLKNFFDYCRQEGCTYSEGKDPKDAYVEIMKQIDTTPIKSSDKTLSLGPAQLDIATSYFLYTGINGWRNLDRGLADASKGSPAKLLSGFAAYIGRAPGGKYDGSYTAFLTIGCADGRLSSADEMIDLAQDVKKQAPIFGETGILLGLPCATWPSDNEAKAFDVDTKDSAPILIVGTTGDPATPVGWARNASKQIINNAYIEVDGDTHTSYGQGIECVDEIVNKYFLDGLKPKSKTCR